MAVAGSLLQLGYSVDVEWNNIAIREKLETRFGIKLGGVNIVKDVNRGDGYDLCFWVSDGSVPTLRARKNLLHFQVPFHDVNGRSLINKMKLFRISEIVCNSEFTKRVIDKEYGVNSLVLYPPVDTKSIKKMRKDNIIIFVGRFSQLKQSKNQHLLIKAFKRFYKAGHREWKLILVGGIEVGAEDYLARIKNDIKAYPIEIIESPDYAKLKELYGRAKIFWSAVGYGENEEKSPEKVEHFGITVVEAMVAGCVPIVYNAGGYKEIVNADNGFLWDEIDELVKITKDLSQKPHSIWKRLILNERNDVRRYSYEVFLNNFGKLI